MNHFEFLIPEFDQVLEALSTSTGFKMINIRHIGSRKIQLWGVKDDINLLLGEVKWNFEVVDNKKSIKEMVKGGD